AMVATAGATEKSGIVTGVLVDESGLAIPRATVNLEDDSGRTLGRATTSASGAFRLDGLPPGRYVVRARVAHFTPAQAPVTVDERGGSPPLRLVLTVAGLQETVNVRDERGSYAEPEASTADKSDSPVMRTPFSVQVVPAQALVDQQAVRLQDVTRNVSGVQPAFGYGDQYEGFLIRGFETNTTLRNGVRVGGEAGRNGVDVANAERVEVLKGPAAILYGRLEPGGLVNVVTKRPLAEPHYAVQQQAGSWDTFRTTADATGPLVANGKLLYRVVGEYLTADQFIVNAPHGRTKFIAPSLIYRPSSRLDLRLDFEYRDAEPRFSGGLPAIGDRPADVPVTTYVGDFGDRETVVRKVADLTVSYELSPAWTMRGTGALSRQDYDAGLLSPATVDETPGPTFGDVSNFAWFVDTRGKGGNAALDLIGRLRTGSLEHHILLGTDYYHLDFSYQGFVNGWNPVDTVNVFSPTYHRPTGFGSNAAYGSTPPDWRSIGSSAWNGLYLQDQVALPHGLHLLVGARYDWARSSSAGVTLEYAPPGTTIDDLVPAEAREEKLSPRIGLLYQPASWLSLYGNYVESLGTWGTLMGIATDANGRPLPSERSHAYEGGVKAEAFSGRLRTTVATFAITKTDVATRDLTSADPTALRAAGEAHSSGVEVDVAGELSPRWSLIASYAYTSAKFTRDDGGLQGNALANVPRHAGSLWVKAEILPGRLAAGSGAVLRGDRQGDNQNSFLLPGYATLDAFAAYTIGAGRSRVILQLNATNLTDRRHYLDSNVYDSNPRAGIMPGAPRTVLASVRWER
ncbi:MAG TPA: TonB-dependent receptor, partial [Vicinamibacteria bacterium]|nr:TonB-dependent receptor [Vicinamibacteria bacterium]